MQSNEEGAFSKKGSITQQSVLHNPEHEGSETNLLKKKREASTVSPKKAMINRVYISSRISKRIEKLYKPEMPINIENNEEQDEDNRDEGDYEGEPVG